MCACVRLSPRIVHCSFCAFYEKIMQNSLQKLLKLRTRRNVTLTNVTLTNIHHIVRPQGELQKQQ